MTVVLVALAAMFAELSLLAFGGGNSILPEMQRLVVVRHHWMSAAEFTALFALAQAAPGPNLMIAPLIGWRVAGIPGMLASALAMFAPSSLLLGIVLGFWRRFHAHPWRLALQHGLVPVTVGLVASSAYLMVASADGTMATAAITAICAGLAFSSRLHPLWLLGAGALTGLAGLI